MGCEALLCPIKPFPIALLCSCLPAKASELSSALLPTEFQKRGSLNHCISEYLHRRDSHTLQSLPSSSTWAGQGCNPTKLHPNPQPWSEPKPPGLLCKLFTVGRNEQPGFTCRTCLPHFPRSCKPSFPAQPGG